MPDVPEDVMRRYIYDVMSYVKAHEACERCMAGKYKECLAGTNYRHLKYEVKGDVLYIISYDCKTIRDKIIKTREKNALEFSKIPKVYEEKTWADYTINAKNNYAVAVAKSIANGKCKGGYIFGNVGTGKTFLASLIAKDIISQNKQVVFGSVPELLADLKQSFEKGTTADILKRYINADFLVLDDIGSENITPWASEQLFLIVNSRVNENKPIVFTSNYRLEHLANRLSAHDKFGNIVDKVNGQRIVSRIMQVCTPALLDGEDRRLA